MTDRGAAIAEPEELAEIVGGHWTNLPAQPIRFVRCALEHTESDLKDFLYAPELFLARNSVGRDTALLTCLAAGERGASAFLVSERPRNLALSQPCLIVDDPAKALSTLAGKRRSESPARFVAVTGSAGKSTTKEMITALLSSKGRALRSVFNYNAGRSAIELTLSNLAPDHEYCCAEFSGVGDIETQSELYRPDVAVITNVLWEHVDRFEKTGLRGEEVIDAIVERKTSLIRNLVQGGHVILNRDNENFQKQAAAAAKRPDVTVVTFGRHKDADVRLVDFRPEGDGSQVTACIGNREFKYRIDIAGEQMAQNSLAALAVSDVLNVDIARALEGLGELEAGFRRGEVHSVPWGEGTITAINETVSSSVPSVRALIKSLSARPVPDGGRRVAVLGWIGELGSTSITDMKQLASEAAASPIDYFFTNGEDMRTFNRSFSDRDRIAPHAGSIDQLRRMLQTGLKPGDVVAIKGNRKPLEFSLRRLWEHMIDPRIAAAPATEANRTPEEVVRVVLGGDTYLGEYYQAARERRAQINYLKEFGYGYSLEKLAPLFQRADVGIVNLECALTEMKRSPLDGKKGFILAGRPAETTAALREIGVNAAMLGNNHAMDYGVDGLRDTLSALEDAGIAAIGAGPDRMSAQAPYTCEFFRRGSVLKLAFVSGYKFLQNYEDAYRFYAGDARWGVNNINMNRLKSQIAELKAEGYYVIVSPHWGENYCFRDFTQKRMAKRMINECRADLILGHGAHVFQEFGKVGAQWVLYSIGNLAFNSEGEYARHDLLPYSYVAELCFGFRDAGWSPALNIYPIVSCNQITQFQPDFVDTDQFEQLATFLRAMSYDAMAFDERIAFRHEDGRHFFQIQLF